MSQSIRDVVVKGLPSDFQLTSWHAVALSVAAVLFAVARNDC